MKLSARHSATFNLAVATDGVPEFMANESTYYARVEYILGTLRVWVSDHPTFGEPVLTVDLDLATLIQTGPDARAWVGLTSATGFSQEGHRIESWELNVCDEDIVSVEETLQPSASSLLIAPSPADQQAVVTLPTDVAGDWTLRVVSMDGRTLYTTSGPDASASLVLPAAQFAPGMYAVLVTTGQRTWTTMWSVVR